MLGFHMHVFRLERAFFHHLGKTLDDDGLRRDGIGGNHLRLREADAFGEGLIAGKETLHRSSPSLSGTMASAPKRHTSTHTPHPLQKS